MYIYSNYQTDQVDHIEQADQVDKANQTDQVDLDDQFDQTDQTQVVQGSLDNGILEPEELINIKSKLNHKPKAPKSRYYYRIRKLRRRSLYRNRRPYRRIKKSAKKTTTIQEEIMNIDPSNYVKKNKINQSYSLISQQNIISSPLMKKTGLLNKKAIPHKNPPIMKKSYEIHPDGQFGFRQLSDKYAHSIESTIEISINNEQFFITRPEVIREICSALDGILEKNLTKEEFRTIELNSDVIMPLG